MTDRTGALNAHTILVIDDDLDNCRLPNRRVKRPGMTFGKPE